MIVWLHPLLLLLGIPTLIILFVAARRLRGLSPIRRNAALTMQSLSALLLIGAIAEPAVPMPDNKLDLVLVLDRSASLSKEGAQQAVDYARGILQAAGPDDRVRFIGAGSEAAQLTPDQITSGGWLPAEGQGDHATDLAGGLRLAGSLFNDTGKRRVVLLTDGWETKGLASDEAARLVQRGIDLQVVALRALGDPEIIAEGLDMPSYARVGDAVSGQVRVYSSKATRATMQVSADGTALTTRIVTLKQGENVIPLDQTAGATGFHHIQVALQGTEDTRTNNNTADSTIVVKDQPKVLVLEDRQGEAAPLANALGSQQMTVDVREPAVVPSQLSALDRYDAIVMDDVAATSLTLDQQRTIQEYVRRNGHGLVVVGGSTSYAKGGYPDSVFEEMLPVSSQPGPRPQQGETALLLVMDRSNSMDEWMGLSNADTKFSMAKEASRLAVDSLRPGDTIGLISFDTENLWSVPPQRINSDADKARVKDMISNIPLGGGTFIYGGVSEAAAAMRQIKAANKHLVLLTDGQDYHDSDYDPLIRSLRAENITLSTIGVGADADKILLTRLARLAQGRYYFTERLDQIPRIVFKELELALKESVAEGKVQPHFNAPSPLLRGFSPEDMPQLSGYDITTAKDQGVVALASDAGQPLLAHWNYGLGRVVAYTSDAASQWASQWLTWSDFARFWSQSVRWSMSSPVNRQLQPSITVGEPQDLGGSATAHISVESLNPDNSFNNLSTIRAALRGPSGNVQQTTLTQTAPGHYEADVNLDEPGAYEVRIVRDGNPTTNETAGFSVPLPAEERHAGSNDRLLKQLANGKPYTTDPTQALDRANLESAPSDMEPLWDMLVPPALLLLLGSVAARRLQIPWLRRRRAG